MVKQSYNKSGMKKKHLKTKITLLQTAFLSS